MIVQSGSLLEKNIELKEIHGRTHSMFTKKIKVSVLYILQLLLGILKSIINSSRTSMD